MQVTKTVKADEMLSVFAIGRNLELIPQPFSGQPSLRLDVPFDAFLQLCKNISDYGEFILSKRSSVLQRLYALHLKGISASTRELQAVFMQEVSYAIMKEISYAEERGKDVTQIRHHFRDVTAVIDEKVIPVLSTRFNDSRDGLQNQLVKHITDLGYKIPLQLSGSNAFNFQYAVVLYSLSKTKLFNPSAPK